MKKFILGITTFICYSTIAQGFEANIKVGYDFYRSSTEINGKDKNNNEFNKYGRGFVVGVEILPLTFKNDKIKLGTGIEYNFGETTVRYENKTIHQIATMIPLYTTAKFTYYRPKNIDLNLYTFARFGYVFAGETPSKNGRSLGYGIKNTSGLYYGLGLGLDYKYFLAEILYDGKYSNDIQQIQSDRIGMIPTSIKTYTPEGSYMIHDFHHKIGVRFGLQLGLQHFKKAKIEHKIAKVPETVRK